MLILELVSGECSKSVSFQAFFAFTIFNPNAASIGVVTEVNPLPVLSVKRALDNCTFSLELIITSSSKYYKAANISAGVTFPKRLVGIISLLALVGPSVAIFYHSF